MEAQREELIASCLETYRSTIDAAGAAAESVCPLFGVALRQNVAPLKEALDPSATPGSIAEAGRQINDQLSDWGRSVAAYFRQKTAEVQQLLLEMTDAARTVAARDSRYRAQFDEVTARLQAAVDLEDLAQVRKLVSDSTNALRSSVERMVAEGREAAVALENKLAQYKGRLAEAERRSETDGLTQLLNRQGIERAAERRLRAGAPFCLVVIDLNNFKAINDIYGHPAGDNLLAQFAHELKSQFRVEDAVGRWGGDEFVVVLECGREEADSRVARVRKWVLGAYTVAGPDTPRKVAIDAAIGVAVSRPGQNVAQVFAEADRAMFEEKRRMPGAQLFRHYDHDSIKTQGQCG